MALTLAEWGLLSQDKLLKGVVQEIIYTEPLMGLLPFMEIEGNSLAINREDPDNTGTAGFVNPVSHTITSSEGKVEQVTFALKELVGQADVPGLVQRTRANINDPMAVQVKLKAKQMAKAFGEQVIYGDASATNGFDGLVKLYDSTNMVVHASADASGASLSMSYLDEAIDMVSKIGKPTAILMSKKMRRAITKYLRTVGSYDTERDDYGRVWQVWGDGIKFVVTDFQNDTEQLDSSGHYSAPTGGSTTSIWVLYISEGDGLFGIQNGGIRYDTWEKLEAVDAARTRLVWYCGIALGSTLSIARIDGILPDADVTA